MSCRYSDFNGVCCRNSPDDGFEHPGINDDGFCICEDDPDPSETCEDYEE